MSTFTCKVLPNALRCLLVTGKIPLFAWGAYFYIGTPILIVKTGKIHCLHGVPIFTAWCPYLL